MQQTEHYKLNIIEPSDTFGPEALNQNAQTVDEVLHGQLQFVTGEYTGDGSHGQDTPNRIEFPFKPLLVVVNDPAGTSYGGMLWMYGAVYGPAYHTGGIFESVSLTWEEHAVSWYSNYSVYNQLNHSGTTYHYFALGILD